jgi:hypothetical protein
MEEAPGVESVVMRDAIGGGAYRGVRKAGVEGRGSLGANRTSSCFGACATTVGVVVVIIFMLVVHGR